MSRCKQCKLPADASQLCQVWSAHVDALDGHLSANRWAMTAFALVVIAYPVARILIPVVIGDVVPEVVRTVLHWM